MAPKVPKKPILLRSEQGHLLGADEAADLLQEWYAALYSDASAQKPPDSLDTLAWPFTYDEIYDERLHLHKALSPH